ncbi:MAG: alkaline phosphatase, partial [Sphaerochaetaceae bacterium]
EIDDVMDLDNAVQVAIKFANSHPDETLIVVTADHETGGMTIGAAATGYNTAFDILRNQKESYVAFDNQITTMKNPSFEEVMALVKNEFGLVAPGKSATNPNLVLSEVQYQKLKDAYKEAMLPAGKRTNNETTALLYGGYNPLSVSLTHILNTKAGIGWTSYAHTGTPVPVFANGVGADLFSGSYDDTDIFFKLKAACQLN